MPTPMNRLVKTPGTWARLIFSSLKPAKYSRRKNGKATNPISVMTTQHTLSSPGKHINPYELSKTPQEPYSSEELTPSTPPPPPVPPKDDYLLNLTTNKRPNLIGNKYNPEGPTLAGIDPPRVLFGPGTTFDGDIPNRKISQNHLCPPPHAPLRRKHGTRQLPSLNDTTHGHASDNSPDPRRDSHNEILSLHPGLPAVVSIDGGDCLVSIVKSLPEYQRDGVWPTDIAVVEACGATTHRVVFMGKNAFLIRVLDHITIPQLPAPLKQGGTQADLIPDLATEQRGGGPNDPSSYTDDINSTSLLIPTRSKGKRRIPRPRTPSPAKFHDFQWATELSRSFAQSIVPQDMPKDHLSPPVHILDRSPLQEPLDFTPRHSILIKHQTHEEAIESIDSNHYPEPGQGSQPPIGTGRPLRMPGLTANYKPNEPSGLTCPNPRFSGAYGGIIETFHETEHGHTPRLPNSIWNL